MNDDDEFARYLTSYLDLNRDEYLEVIGADVVIHPPKLYEVIKRFMETLP